MIDERFSASAFEALRSPSDRVALERDLQEAIETEVAPALKQTLAEVAARLNELGHGLQSTDDAECYDDGKSAEGTLRLRVCLDPTITVIWRGGAV
jgi:hypothetical protein